MSDLHILTPAQARFFELPGVNIHHYAMAALFKSKEKLIEKNISVAVAAVVKQNQALNLCIHQNGETYRQYIKPFDAKHQYLDIYHINAENHRFIMQTYDHIIKNMNVFSGPMARFCLFKLNDADYDLFFVAVHHMVADGISIITIMQDITDAYHCLQAGKKIHLNMESNDYFEYIQAIDDMAHSLAVKKELSYWSNINNKNNQFPMDTDNNVNIRREIETRRFQIIGAEHLAEFTRHKASMHFKLSSLVLTALVLTAHEMSGQTELLVDVINSGRLFFDRKMNLNRTVGWINTITPILLHLKVESKDNFYQQAIKDVRNQLLSTPNQGVYFNVLRYLVEEGKKLKENCKTNILFNYCGEMSQQQGGGDLFELLVSNKEWLDLQHDMDNQADYPFHIDIFHKTTGIEGVFDFGRNSFTLTSVDKIVELVKKNALMITQSGGQ